MDRELEIKIIKRELDEAREDWERASCYTAAREASTRETQLQNALNILENVVIE